jgi:hypothetical protein
MDFNSDSYSDTNSNSPQDKLFFLNLYKLHSLYILMDFYQREFAQGPLDQTAPKCEAPLSRITFYSHWLQEKGTVLIQLRGEDS